MRARPFALIAALAVALWSLPVFFLPTAPAWAVNPDEVLADPALEKRAREISKSLRCLVCQNQSIDDSDADLAKDLRIIVRERLLNGNSDSQVIDYVVARYGDFVLLKPPFKGTTLVLWLGPAVIVGLGIMAMVLFLRRRRSPVSGTRPGTGKGAAPGRPEPLSAEEKRRLERLMKDGGP